MTFLSLQRVKEDFEIATITQNTTNIRIVGIPPTLWTIITVAVAVSRINYVLMQCVAL